MPNYPTIGSLPTAKAVETRNAFITRLTAAGEMAWLNGNAITYDIPALPAESSPLLCCVKVADEWDRETISRVARYDCWYDIGLRLYFFADKTAPANTVAQVRDTLENANEVMVRVIRSGYMQCHKPYWNKLELAKGRGRTSVFGRVDERLFITTHLRVLRHFVPGT